MLEVDTPALSKAAVTAPYLHSFTVSGAGSKYYLHTSPEFAMKRLLAAGSGDIYQIAKVFRAAELGARHNPEFTLLEWYRLGFDPQRLMDEVAELIIAVLLPSEAPQVQRFSYRELFQHYLECDPLRATARELAHCASRCGLTPPDSMPDNECDPWLDLLFSHCIEPQLDPKKLIFVFDFPASQAALARIRPDNPPVAERFELYWGGLELANGFHELNDAAEQRARFEADNQARTKLGLPQMPLDEHLLAALPYLPDCAGVALGIDRLLMVLTGKTRISEVLAFSSDQA